MKTFSKKILSTLVAILMAMSCATATFAGEPVDIADSNSHVLFLQDKTDIEAHNRRAEELWQQALARSTETSCVSSDEATIQPRIYTVNSESHTIWFAYLLKNADLSFEAIYNTTTSSDNTVIGTVYGVSAYATSSSTDVSVTDCQYTKIDGGRTLAANYALRVGVLDDDNVWHTESYSFYVEFYANGGATVYA